MFTNRNSPAHSFQKERNWIQQHNCMCECRDTEAGFILSTTRDRPFPPDCALNYEDTTGKCV